MMRYFTSPKELKEKLINRLGFKLEDLEELNFSNRLERKEDALDYLIDYCDGVVVGKEDEKILDEGQIILGSWSNLFFDYSIDIIHLAFKHLDFFNKVKAIESLVREAREDYVFQGGDFATFSGEDDPAVWLKKDSEHFDLLNFFTSAWTLDYPDFSKMRFAIEDHLNKV